MPGPRSGPRLHGDSACSLLDRFDVRGLQALGAGANFEAHALRFLQGLVAVHLDRGVMREEVGTTLVRSDEAEALGVVEPFDDACCHFYFLQLIETNPSPVSGT